MANKAFLTFTGISIDGAGPAFGLCFGVVFDAAGNVLPSPTTEDGHYYGASASFTRASTWSSIKTDLETGLKAVFGSTTTIVWLDDKGLL